MLKKALLGLVLAGSTAARGMSLEGEMAALVAAARAEHPRAAAARAERERITARRVGAEKGFKDPLWSLSAGRTEGVRSLSGVPAIEGLPGHAAVVQTSVERPLWPGLYAQAGWSERYLYEPPGLEEQVYQTLLGVRLRAPLWRDRGFRTWRIGMQALEAEERAGREAERELWQTLRHEVETRYLAWITAVNIRSAADLAADRFEALLEDARQRAQLDALPAYQVEPARMEWELRREEALAAASEERVALAQLREISGAFTPRADPFSLVSWAASATLPPVGKDTAAGARAAYRRLLAEREDALALRESAREALRPDLSLEARITWQSEDPSRALSGGSALVEDDRAGGTLLLVYRRHGHRHRQKAALAEARAYEAAVEAGLETFLLRMESALAATQTAFLHARQRLDVVSRAVEAADAAVEGERDRFRLGEGSSRAVLDAQKDHTAAVLRQTRIAAELLQARANYLFHCGYPPQEGQDGQPDGGTGTGPGR